MGLFNNMKDVKKAVWLYEAHCCSHCGEQNVSRQKIILKYSYDEIALSRSQTQRNSAALQKLDDAAREIAERAADRTDVGKYYALNLLGKCKSCGHREPWSRMRVRGFDTVFNALVAMSTVAVIAAVVELFMDGNGWMLLPAVGLTAVTVGMKLAQKFRRRRREQQIAALDERYIPFLTEDETAFRERFPKADIEKLTTVEPSGYYQVTDP